MKNYLEETLKYVRREMEKLSDPQDKESRPHVERAFEELEEIST